MAFELPRVEKCFYCISLRMGSLLIGYLSILSSALCLAVVSWSLYRVVHFVKGTKDNPNPEHPPAEVAKIALGLYVSHAYFILVYFYHFVMNLLLVVGVHRNKPNYLRLYFKLGICLLALAVTLIVVTSIFMGFYVTVPLLIWDMIIFYFLLVIRSTYLEMEEQNKPRVYEMKSLYNPQQAPLIA